MSPAEATRLTWWFLTLVGTATAVLVTVTILQALRAVERHYNSGGGGPRGKRRL